MSRSGLKLEDLLSRAEATRAALQGRPSRTWSLAGLTGRLVELSGLGASASLTLAFALVLTGQRQGEPAAWITTREESFYPPDVAEGGVDLDALVVVRVPDARAGARAADRLVRSGAFGVIVLDVGAAPAFPTPLQARLAGLAEKHHTALVCLTAKGDQIPSLGSLVSLRVHAQRRRIAGHRFSSVLIVLKDKRSGPTWGYREVCRGPAGVR